MSPRQKIKIDERIRRALDELQALIRERYPTATFSVYRGEDPEGIYLRAVVDVEDADEVVDVFRDRLLDMQIEEGLPIYVIPLEPVERVLEQMRSESVSGSRRHRGGGSALLDP